MDIKPKAQHDDYVDLSVILNQLYLNKWIVIAVVFVTMSFGFFYLRNQVTLYQSDVLVQVDSSVSSTKNFTEQLLMGGSSSQQNFVITQIALIKSRFILSQVVNDLNLDVISYPKPPPFWKSFFVQNTQKDALNIKTFKVSKNYLNKPFKLIVDKKNHFELFDKDNHSVLSGAVGSLIVNNDKNIQLNVSSINATPGTNFVLIKSSILGAVNSLSHNLSIEEVGSRSQRGTGILNISYKGETPDKVVNILNTIVKVAREQDAKRKSQEALQVLSFLHRQLPVTKRQLEQAEKKLNLYRSESGKIDIKLQTQVLLNQLAEIDKKLAELQLNKLEMQSKYTKKHPIYVEFVEKIKELESQQSLLQDNLKSLPSSDQIAINLQRDVEVKNSLYMVLLTKIQELQVVKAGTVSGLRILAYATSPDTPLASHKKSILLSCLFMGILIALLLIWMKKLFISNVEDPNWIEQKFNVPNLAIIPYSPKQKEKMLKHKKIGVLPLLAYTDSKDIVIESLRSLRTSMQISLLGASGNVVAMLGVSPSVGKSFISANLACLLAVTGKKVLVIDADLRKGTQHKYMDLPSFPGVTDIVNHNIPSESAIHKTFQENLYLIPKGNYVHDPSELLASNGFATLINEVSKQFDIVILDTAPILLVTDAVLVARQSAINYMVFGAGVHKPNELDTALKRLFSSGISVHGSIFNFQRSKFKKSSYYYNYGKYKYDSDEPYLEK